MWWLLETFFQRLQNPNQYTPSPFILPLGTWMWQLELPFRPADEGWVPGMVEWMESWKEPQTPRTPWRRLPHQHWADYFQIFNLFKSLLFWVSVTHRRIETELKHSLPLNSTPPCILHYQLTILLLTIDPSQTEFPCPLMTKPINLPASVYTPPAMPFLTVGEPNSPVSPLICWACLSPWLMDFIPAVSLPSLVPLILPALKDHSMGYKSRFTFSHTQTQDSAEFPWLHTILQPLFSIAS